MDPTRQIPSKPVQATLTTKQEHEAGTNGIAYHTVYVAGTTPWKQNDVYASCVPSLILCRFSQRTLLQTEKDHSKWVGNGQNSPCMRAHEWETAWHGLPPFQNVKQARLLDARCKNLRKRRLLRMLFLPFRIDRNLDINSRKTKRDA